MTADDDKRTHRHTAGEHSTIGADENLDQYGVWVKSGPEDVPEEDSEDTGISDLEPEMDVEEFEQDGERSENAADGSDEELLDSLPDLPDETDLSEEEEQLLADLEDTDAEPEAPAEETGTPAAESAAGDFDLEIPESDEDFSMDLEDELSSDELSGEGADEWALNLPESDESESEAPTEAMATQDDYAMELPEEQEEPASGSVEESVGENAEHVEAVGEMSSEVAEELEEVGGDEQNLDESDDEDTDSRADSEDDVDIAFRYAESEEELPDLEFGDADELVLDDEQTGEEAGVQSSETAFAEETVTENTVTEETDESTPLSVEEQTEAWQTPAESDEEDSEKPVTEIALEPAGEDDDFDDISAVTSELSAPTGGSQEAGPSQGGYSPEAFEQIQSELSSIKSELSALKAELQGLRSTKPHQSHPEPEAVPSAPDETEKPATDTSESSYMPDDSLPEEDSSGGADFDQVTEGGFFEEDEDETIALTGDELDNILNTAEFTEEQGKPTDPDEGDMDVDLSAVESRDPQHGGAGHEGAEGVVFDDIDEPRDADHDESESTLEQQASEVEELDETDEIPEDLIVTLDSEETGESEFTEEGPADDSSAALASAEEGPESSGPEELFGASEDHVDALANMDIDTELADIEELDDESGGSVEEPGEGVQDSGSIETDVTSAEADEPADTGAPADQAGEQAAMEAAFEQPGEEATPDAHAEPGDEATPDAHAEPAETGSSSAAEDELPENLREEIRTVLSYMDQLLESLPEEKIREFANSEHFEVYKRLFEELGLEP